jgi:error-prone DNA polymerase
MKHGEHVVIGGLVICRQRPGTAKGHVFISLEDETGIANAFVPSPLFEARRLVITQEPFLQIRGRLQTVDNVITVYALKVEALRCHTTVDGQSHDFH